MRRCARVALRGVQGAPCVRQPQQRCATYHPHASTVEPLVRATKEDVEKYGADATALEEPPTVIGMLNPDGTVGSAESLLMFKETIKAQWNPSNRRVELVRETNGIRLTAWVKGAQYIQSELESIEPLKDFWSAEEIDERGGVMVMSDLGRIPGEAAEQKSLAEAIEYMVAYDATAAVGAASGQKPAWFQEDEEMKSTIDRQQTRLRMITAGGIALVFAQILYFGSQLFGPSSPVPGAPTPVAHTEYKAPSLNK